MNGGSNVPPWPPTNAQNRKMFAVPTQLKEDDEIIIRGIMTDGRLDIALRPDGNDSNILCQINVIYSQNESHDQITLRSVRNGDIIFSQDYKASGYFFDTSFEVRFIITTPAIRVSIREAFLEPVTIAYDAADIRFISVIGQVQEMNFSFNAY